MDTNAPEESEAEFVNRAFAPRAEKPPPSLARAEKTRTENYQQDEVLRIMREQARPLGAQELLRLLQRAHPRSHVRARDVTRQLYALQSRRLVSCRDSVSRGQKLWLCL